MSTVQPLPPPDPGLGQWMYLQWSRIVRTLGKTGNIIAEKTSGLGIQVDPDSPTFGWKAMISKIVVKGTGANDPDWAVFRSPINAYEFGNAKMHECWVDFHVPNDYVPATDMYLTLHWAQKTVDTGGTAGVPGVAKWYVDFTYSDNHGTAGGAADPFPATKTLGVTQQASTTQYGCMGAEIQITNNGGDATHLDRNTIVVSGIFLLRIYRDPADVADTLDQPPYVLTVDLNYQTTNIGTKNRSPDFYT